METLDIVQLINNSNSATILSEKYANKLLNKIIETFTTSQQQMYVANFYCFLKHDSDKDFIIVIYNLDNFLVNKTLEMQFKIIDNFLVNTNQEL